MYDIDNKTLYYKNHGSYEYYHEYGHYLFNEKYGFKLLNYFLSVYNQLIQMVGFISFISLTILQHFMTINFINFVTYYFVFMLPYMTMIFIEEAFCDIYAMIKLSKNHK